MLSLARDRSRTADAAFVPTRLPGCALWLRADLGITLNGSTVSAWANQGTLGGSVSTATFQIPVDGPGHRVRIRFDGDADGSDLHITNLSLIEEET